VNQPGRRQAPRVSGWKNEPRRIEPGAFSHAQVASGPVMGLFGPDILKPKIDIGHPATHS
jgi:hypothetical protein